MRRHAGSASYGGTRARLRHLLDDAGRPIEAQAQFEELVAADPKDPAPWRDAGDLLARRGDRTKAREAFREALRLAPGDAKASEGLQQLQWDFGVLPDTAGALTAAGDEGGVLPSGGVLPPQQVLPPGPVPERGLDSGRQPADTPR